MDRIEISPAFTKVLDFINHTNRTIFLTGKAGTGKTTLLRYIRENTFKQTAVCAPTGVAAINAGGTTLHSFLQLPFGPYLPESDKSGSENGGLPVQKLNAQRLAIIRSLELLVIDEVSMVRADLLDLVDSVLRQVRRRRDLPFGGVQVLLIGDMHQLPPVVQPEEWKLLSAHYDTPYFFDSRVVRSFPPVYIELQKIYRQNDALFIDLLNKIRSNQADAGCLRTLNERYRSDWRTVSNDGAVTLTTHNRKADEINQQNLDRLQGKPFLYEAEIKDVFPEKSFPAEQTLVLKTGARVMFIRNNAERNYFNGKCGIITSLSNDRIMVKCEGDADEITVTRDIWEHVAYKLNESTGKLEERLLGTFTQFPLRLAWAITIHKSQGLTFDRLVLDAADSFASGQVYVALSRCRTLEGLTLSSRIPASALMTDQKVSAFSSRSHNDEQLSEIYDTARRDYAGAVLGALFDFAEAQAQWSDLCLHLAEFARRLTGDYFRWKDDVGRHLEDLSEVARKFRSQLSVILAAQAHEEQLRERVSKAAAYFVPAVSGVITAISGTPLRATTKEAAAAVEDAVNALRNGLILKRHLMEGCSEGFDLQRYAQRKLAVTYPEPMALLAGARSVQSRVNHPKLLKELLAVRDAICSEEEVPSSRVATVKSLEAVASLLPMDLLALIRIPGFGRSRVTQYGERFIAVVRSYAEQHGLPAEAAGEENKLGLPNNTTVKGQSREQSVLLFKSGMDAAKIAETRRMAVGTIESHLAQAVGLGDISISEVMDEGKQILLATAMAEWKPEEETMSILKTRLPDSVSWSDIRYMIAHKKYAAAAVTVKS